MYNVFGFYKFKKLKKLKKFKTILYKLFLNSSPARIRKLFTWAIGFIILAVAVFFLYRTNGSFLWTLLFVLLPLFSFSCLVAEVFRKDQLRSLSSFVYPVSSYTCNTHTNTHTVVCILCLTFLKIFKDFELLFDLPMFYFGPSRVNWIIS